MSSNQSPCAASLSQGIRPSFAQARTSSIADLWRLVSEWSARARQRRDLARLTDGQLWDIGVRREDALVEARKPFWQA